MIRNAHVYLVTGAAGFIGSAVCKKILSKDNNALVVGIDNLNTYYSKKIKQYRLIELKEHSNFIFSKTSITEAVKLRLLINEFKPSVLIHTAAEVGVRNGEQFPVKYFSTNVVGTLSMLEACRTTIRHAVIFSSSSVYGNCSNVPFSEQEPIQMSTPISTYGASKTAMEIAVKNFYEKTKIPISLIRPFSVYGPNGRPDMLPMKLLISAKNESEIDIYSPEKLSRDWTYIDDFTHMLLSTLYHPNGFRIFNIGTGKPVLLKDVLDIAKTIIKQHGYSLQLRKRQYSSIEMLQTWANNKKILDITGGHDMKSFEDGFASTANFFFSHLYLYD